MIFAMLWALAGLAIYAYLPIAAARAPLLNWGDPHTLQRFWWHITGRQFQAYFSLSPASVGSQLATFADFAVREFGPPWLPAVLALAVAGFCALFRRDRTIFWFLLLVIAADLMYASTYEIAEDKAAYFLPAFLAIVLASGWGARFLIEVANDMRFRHAAQAAGAALLLMPVVVLAGNLRFNDHHRDFIAHDYVDNILETIQPGGMLLTLDWQVYSPMLYVRTIERARRDAVVVDLNLLRRSWYFGLLEREYPRLMEQTRADVEAFLEDLRHWEQDPELYQRDRALNERIDTRFTSMIVAFIAAQLRTAPVCVTQDVLLSAEVQGSRLTKALTGTYQFVPQGLVFQLFADRVFHEPAVPPLRTRGLVDGTLRFAPDDVVLLKVLPVYVTMPYNRGRYLAANGRHADAVTAFRQALAFNPAFALAQRGLADSLKTVHAPDGPPS
jgi:tetratricopeptide (TPR) repeat protein